MSGAVAGSLPGVAVPRLWPGETVTILGGGSSLTAADVAFVRGKSRVIAVKEAAVCAIPGHVAPAPWADLLYAADEKWWRHVHGAPDFVGMKFAIEPQRELWPNVHVLKNLGETGLELQDRTGVRTGYNSGYQAINLAVLLGATKIRLLGFDMWTGPSGDQNWFGDHPTHTRSPYPLFLSAFETIREPLHDAGIEVINCSRWTMLRVFPQMAIEQVSW